VEGRQAPLLGYFPSDDTGYRSPERGNADPPTESDDAWAAAALLHKMLLALPHHAKVTLGTELREAGVMDGALSAALAHALSQDPEQRSRDVRPLKRELARWFVEQAGEEPQSPGPHSTSPPPLPPGTQRPLAGTGAPPGSLRPQHSPPDRGPQSGRAPHRALAVGGNRHRPTRRLDFNAMRPRPEPPKLPAPSAQAPAPPASEKPIVLGDVPVTGESEKTVAPNDKLSSCVMGYFPKDTFASAPDLSGVWRSNGSESRRRHAAAWRS